MECVNNSVYVIRDMSYKLRDLISVKVSGCKEIFTVYMCKVIDI